MTTQVGAERELVPVDDWLDTAERTWLSESDLLRHLTEKLPESEVLSYFPNLDPQTYTFDREELRTEPQESFEVASRSQILLRGHRPGVQAKFISAQQWEGVVSNIKTDTFLARLADLTEAGPEEEAEIQIEDISEEDRQLLEPGAVFYWNIGYYESSKGQRIRGSIIRFRRMPAWSDKDLEKAQIEARELRNNLGWK